MPYSDECVLIVDNDKDARLYARRWVEKALPGAKVLMAVDGLDGAITFLEYFPSLVVSDVDMPVMNGIEMTKKILQIREDAIIVLMTGHAERESADLGVEVSGFIKKNASDQEVTEMLRKVMKVRGVVVTS